MSLAPAVMNDLKRKMIEDFDAAAKRTVALAETKVERAELIESALIAVFAMAVGARVACFSISPDAAIREVVRELGKQIKEARAGGAFDP